MHYNDQISRRLLNVVLPETRLGFVQALQATEHSREDVHLHGFLTTGFRVFDALVEVVQHLQSVLVRDSREDLPKQGNRQIYDGNAQR